MQYEFYKNSWRIKLLSFVCELPSLLHNFIKIILDQAWEITQTIRDFLDSKTLFQKLIFQTFVLGLFEGPVIYTTK